VRLPGFLRRSVRRKLTALVLTSTLAALAVTAVALGYYAVEDYQKRELADVRTLAEIVGRASGPALAFDDREEASRDLALLSVRNSVEAAALYTADGLLFAYYVRRGDAADVPARPGEPGERIAGNYLTVVHRIVEGGETVGTLVLQSRYEVRRRLVAYMLILGTVMAGALGAALLVSAWLQREVTEPILRVAAAARGVIERRDFSMRLGRTTEDEIGTLADAMNRMLGDLEREIAERRSAEGALRLADRRKDEFLATLAHELRNPLAPIRNSLHLLRLEHVDPATQDEARAIIERQIDQVIRLVDDLVEVSRITTGKLQLRFERVDLRQVAEAAIEAAEPIVRARAHTLRLDLPLRGTTIEADPTRLVQVFLNLLNNAAKFTEPGGRIDFSLDVQEGQVVGRVRDNGVGIAAEMIEPIFEMFAQADRSLERTTAGLGVGLSLSRRLIELHGGTIEARSAGAGTGAEFIVRLPARRLEAPASAIEADGEARR
jgi:two-component system, sensor histidine kinase